jgi:protoporphyrinogen oxidase
VDLVVLGAGPAGLAAAWRAALTGRAVTVLERGATVGGMAGSFTVAGVRVDHGSHRLHPSIARPLLADLAALLGADLQLRPRNGRLRVAERWVGFPLRAGELIRSLPPSLLVRAAVDAVTAPVRARTTPPASYADALRRGLGPALYGALYEPYAGKLWGRPGEEIDAEQARRRVSADTPWKIVGRMLRSGDSSGDGVTAGRCFYYPRRGYGQISEAMADAATSAGAVIRTSTEATRVLAGPDGVRVDTADGATITAERLFSTIPLPVLARVTEPAPPAAVVAAAGALNFRAMVLVYLVHDGSRPWTTYDAHYLPQPDTPFTRVSEPANYRTSAEDPTDRTVLCCELPCEPDGQHWTADDATLGALAVGHLAAAGLPPINLGEVHTRRLRRVYPVYEIGYREHLKGLDDWAARLPRVTTFGRLGLFAHDNTHHAMTMAYDAVDALAAGPGGFDATAWAAARRRFEGHVVED